MSFQIKPITVQPLCCTVNFKLMDVKMDTKYTIQIEEIPKMSFKLLLTLIPTVVFPFFILYNTHLSQQIQILSQIMNESFFLYLLSISKWTLIFLLSIISGIIAHEFIHAIFFSIFLPSKFKGVKFGFNSEHGIPYVHVIEPISILGLRVGAVMPLMILGIIPILVGLYFGIATFTLFGIIFTISSSGDLLLISKTKGLSLDQIIEDLPDGIGFALISNESSKT